MSGNILLASNMKDITNNEGGDQLLDILNHYTVQ
jgi:hypothetical protein